MIQHFPQPGDRITVSGYPPRTVRTVVNREVLTLEGDRLPLHEVEELNGEPVSYPVPRNDPNPRPSVRGQQIAQARRKRS